MNKKHAFTMVELVLVIVVFGIIATIGAKIIAKMYENYITSKITTQLQFQSEITLKQIAKRLQYRVKESTVALDSVAGHFLALQDTRVDTGYTVIQWIGYSNEALIGVPGAPRRTGWSGFIDLYSADTDRTRLMLSTPGSSLGEAANIMSALSNGRVTLGANREAALIFKTKALSIFHDVEEGYGYDGHGGAPEYILKVRRDTDTTFAITNLPAGTDIKILEHYYLAHSAYAITKGSGGDRDFDLILNYNYQPWLGMEYDDADAQTAILARHVNLFRMREGGGGTIQMKLCINSENFVDPAGKNIVACKEEVVL